MPLFHLAPASVARAWACASLVIIPASTHAQARTQVEQLKLLSIEDLMEVTVTSVFRAPVALHEAPSALQVITNTEIRRSGATSLPEALRLANNLNVAQKSGSNWGVSARGFNTELSNKLLVLLDGRTLYTPLFSGVRWNVQDYLLEDVERIEAVSGPGGTLWGANAVNGVINITTKSARDTQGVYAEAATGTQLDARMALRYGGRINDKIHYRFYGQRTERDGELFASGQPSLDDGTLTQGGFRLDATTGTGASTTLQGDYYLGREGLPTGGRGKNIGGNVLGRWIQPLRDGSEVTIQAYYDSSFFRQAVAASPFAGAGYFSDALEIYDLDVTHQLPLDQRHHLVWGLGYRHLSDNTTSAPSLGFQPEDVQQDLYSGFIQDQFSITPRDVLTVGIKWDRNQYTGSEFSPTIRFQHNFEDQRTVWAAVSRAVRMPSRIDNDIRQPSAGPTILRGENFQSETVVAYETGVRARLGQNLAGTLALFVNDYGDIRSVGLTPQTLLPLVFRNDLKAKSYGAELSLNYDVTPWWHLQGGYTLLETDVDIRPGGFDLNNTLNETADPESQLSITSSMDLGRNWQLDFQGRWVDSLVINNEGQPAQVPAYGELNARLAYRIPSGIELSIVGQNLLDQQHPEFWPPGPRRVEIRRSVYAKIAWRY